MAFLPDPDSPSGIIPSIKAFFAPDEDRRKRFTFALLAPALIGFFAIAFAMTEYEVPPKKNDIIYVSNWPANRSLEETKKQIDADQKKRDERDAMIKAAKEEQRQKMENVAKAFGLD
jgi:hypothetical protein